MYKEWMIKFYWAATGNKEVFYFETKEDMIKFSKTPGIWVEAMFHLEKVTE